MRNILEERGECTERWGEREKIIDVSKAGRAGARSREGKEKNGNLCKRGASLEGVRGKYHSRIRG